ncbi:MAG: energy transducer TonB [Bacteroidetes bacterium]|nr:energy transducer TonB [Bacteroidota bacterium]
MMKYFQDSIRFAIEKLKKNKEGNVLSEIKIDDDGVVVSARIINGVANAPNFAKETERVLLAIPRWMPAMKNGKAVPCTMYLSVPFFINEKNRGY